MKETVSWQGVRAIRALLSKFPSINTCRSNGDIEIMEADDCGIRLIQRIHWDTKGLVIESIDRRDG